MKNQQRLQDTLNWLEGIPYEITFWKYTFQYKKRLQSLLTWSKLNSTLCLQGWDAITFLSSLPTSNPKVLDVGCGMSYATGNLDKQSQPLNIHYIDALATHFNRIKNRYQPSLPNIEFGMMEYLSAFYPNHDISLIIIQNALDHCSNPMKAILEALDSLHIGGILYLNHHPNEAEFEHYRGFHKFNICKDSNHFLIWNKTTQFIVDDEVRPFAKLLCKEVDGNPIAIITKTANVSDELLQRNQDVKILCDSLLQQNQLLLSPIRVWHMHLRVLFYKIAHATIQFFPWKTRQTIKKILNKLHP